MDLDYYLGDTIHGREGNSPRSGLRGDDHDPSPGNVQLPDIHAAEGGESEEVRQGGHLLAPGIFDGLSLGHDRGRRSDDGAVHPGDRGAGSPGTATADWRASPGRRGGGGGGNLFAGVWGVVASQNLAREVWGGPQSPSGR